MNVDIPKPVFAGIVVVLIIGVGFAVWQLSGGTPGARQQDKLQQDAQMTAPGGEDLYKNPQTTAPGVPSTPMNEEMRQRGGQ